MKPRWYDRESSRTHRHRYAGDFWNLERKMRENFIYDDLSVHDEKFDGYVPQGAPS